MHTCCIEHLERDAETSNVRNGSSAGRRFVESSLAALCHAGAKIVRLDAFGYATKKAGTRCFFEVLL